MHDHDTKTAILDAAEQLFAQKGFAATSLRTIIKTAGVNTASVHYHFGSKEGLMAAVIRRHATPLNETRLRALDACEGRHPEGALPLDDVVEAFLSPTIERMKQARSANEPLPHLFARAVSESDEKLRKIIRDVFQPVFERFFAAFRRALPGLSDDDIHWRMHFMLGAMVLTLTVPCMHEFDDTPADPEAMTQRLIAFIVGGMRNPARTAAE